MIWDHSWILHFSTRIRANLSQWACSKTWCFHCLLEIQSRCLWMCQNSALARVQIRQLPQGKTNLMCGLKRSKSRKIQPETPSLILKLSSLKLTLKTRLSTSLPKRCQIGRLAIIHFNSNQDLMLKMNLRLWCGRQRKLQSLLTLIVPSLCPNSSPHQMQKVIPADSSMD